MLRPANAWFWGAHGGGKIDLLIFDNGRRLGFEMKFTEAPEATKSMFNVVEALRLDHVFILAPCNVSFPVN